MLLIMLLCYLASAIFVNDSSCSWEVVLLSVHLKKKNSYIFSLFTIFKREAHQSFQLSILRHSRTFLMDVPSPHCMCLLGRELCLCVPWSYKAKQSTDSLTFGSLGMMVLKCSILWPFSHFCHIEIHSLSQGTFEAMAWEGTIGKEQSQLNVLILYNEIF